MNILHFSTSIIQFRQINLKVVVFICLLAYSIIVLYKFVYLSETNDAISMDYYVL